MSRLAIALLLGLAFRPEASAAEEIWIFHSGLMCPEGKSVAYVLDAPTEDELRLRLAHTIVKGDCLLSSSDRIPPRRISKPDRKVTATGKRYVCFREAKDKNDKAFESFANCAMENSVTTLEGELRRRTGDYQITQRFADAEKKSDIVLAKCAEGGEVLVAVQEKGTTRTSMLFMNVETVEEIPIAVSGELRSLLRDGCKGVDYRPRK
jgi:hypothetical protein